MVNFVARALRARSSIDFASPAIDIRSAWWTTGTIRPSSTDTATPTLMSLCKTTPSSLQLAFRAGRSEEHTSELQSQSNLVCRLLLEKKKQQRQHCCSLAIIGARR